MSICAYFLYNIIALMTPVEFERHKPRALLSSAAAKPIMLHSVLVHSVFFLMDGILFPLHKCTICVPIFPYSVAA